MMIGKEAAKTIAVAIRPQIKAYVEANREKFEAFLQAEKERQQGAA